MLLILISIRCIGKKFIYWMYFLLISKVDRIHCLLTKLLRTLFILWCSICIIERFFHFFLLTLFKLLISFHSMSISWVIDQFITTKNIFRLKWVSIRFVLWTCKLFWYLYFFFETVCDCCKEFYQCKVKYDPSCYKSTTTQHQNVNKCSLKNNRALI